MSNHEQLLDQTKAQSPNKQDIDDNLLVDPGQVKSTKEYGGPKGKEPTRYGDWEKKGRCVDF
jgi:hypothetical protein